MVLSTTETRERYRRLFADHHRAIYAYFRRRIEVESAQDCTAETFLIAWRRIDDVPDGGELRWLYITARNVLRNVYRSKRRSFTVPGIDRDVADCGETPEVVLLRHEEEAAVRAALEHLRPDDREVLLLSVWEELPRDDIAAILGCSPHAVSQRLHRASGRLAKELDRVTTTPINRVVPTRVEELP